MKVILFLLGCCVTAQAGETGEFDPTVIEAAGGFTGAMAVHVKSEDQNLVVNKYDFKKKIVESLSEMDDLPALKNGGAP